MATPLLRALSCGGGHDSPCRGLTQNSHIFFGKIIGISTQLPPSDISFTGNTKWLAYTYLITEPLHQTKLGEIVTVITDIRQPLVDQVFVHANRTLGGTLIEGHSCPKLYTSSLPQYIRRSIRAGYKKASLQLYVTAGLWDSIPATILLEGPVRREVQFTPGQQLVVKNLPPGIYKITAAAEGYVMQSPYLTYNVGPYSCPVTGIEMVGR